MNFFLEISIGFSVGLAIGLTGVGGGILILPVLIHILKIPPVLAVGTGLVFSSVSRIIGTISHFSAKTIRFRRSFYFLIGGTPGVIVSSKLVNSLLKIYDTETVNSYLQNFIGIIVLIASIVIILQLFSVHNEKRNNLIKQSRILPVSLSEKLLAMLIGCLIGILIGATSVGGGVFIIPLFIILFKANTKQAVGTSIFISLFLSILGSIVYFIHGNIEISTTVMLCLGAIGGVFLGSRLTDKIPEPALIIIIAIIVGISGISMFFC